MISHDTNHYEEHNKLLIFIESHFFTPIALAVFFNEINVNEYLISTFFKHNLCKLQ